MITVQHDVHVYLHGDNTLRSQLDRIEQAITRQGATMSKELDDLKAEVERNSSVDASALALIKGLADQITAAADNPRAVRLLADQLRAQNDALAAAVTANTPADNTGTTGTTSGEVIDTGTSTGIPTEPNP